MYGEGGAVDRNDPELLDPLERLYLIFNEYDPSSVYNMDETCIFIISSLLFCMVKEELIKMTLNVGFFGKALCYSQSV